MLLERRLGELEDAFWDGRSRANAGSALHLPRDVKSSCRIHPSIHRGGGWMWWEEGSIWRVVPCLPGTLLGDPGQRCLFPPPVPVCQIQRRVQTPI